MKSGRKAAILVRAWAFKEELKRCLKQLRSRVRSNGFRLFGEYVVSGYPQQRSRPVMLEFMNDMREKRFRAVFVSHLNCFGNSPNSMLKILQEMLQRNVSVVSLREDLSTLNYNKKQLRKVISSLTEACKVAKGFQISQAMKAAKDNGVQIGRPRVNKDVVDKVLQLRQRGWSYGQIAWVTKRTRASVVGICRRARSK